MVLKLEGIENLIICCYTEIKILAFKIAFECCLNTHFTYFFDFSFIGLSVVQILWCDN